MSRVLDQAPAGGAFAPSIDHAVRVPALQSLTGLRWIAAFVVFAYHIRNLNYFNGGGYTAMSYVFGGGYTGVSLFFLLSGFVLAWADRPGVSIAGFWKRRVARIYPLHLVCLAVALALAATILPGIASPHPLAALANLTLTNVWSAEWYQAGNPVSWSLAVEAFFYLLFPFVIRYVRVLNNAGLWLLGAVALGLVFALPTFWWQLPSLVASSASPLARLPEFVLGVTLGALMRRGAWRGPRLLPAAVIALAGYAYSQFYPMNPYGFAAITVVGYALLIAALARADLSGRFTVLSSRPLVRLGEISFAFYLIHLLVVGVIASAWPGGAPQAPLLLGAALTLLAFTVALGLAWMLWKFVEIPGRNAVLGWGKKKRARSGARRASGVPGGPAAVPGAPPSRRTGTGPSRRAAAVPQTRVGSITRRRKTRYRRNPASTLGPAVGAAVAPSGASGAIPTAAPAPTDLVGS
ncbi:acyltransferase family protein [Herbiconiux solani]|uniref:acyltransferase family protein n=1 Tax=Herbiconiux solani TaxID=661329 RepID=UPI000826309E|nr:acyltransferase [Herbiconiux solani]